MTDEPHSAPGPDDLTSFVSSQYYILGVGETIDDVQATGEWVATDSPVEISC